jgi:predicted CopG family antitoxin
MNRTTISVSEEVADKLHSLKERGDSYDDVIRWMLSELGEGIDESTTDQE